MDLNEFRCFVSESGVDVWAWIDMSISLACEDHGEELKKRRDGIVQKLYSSPAAFSRCRACDGGGDDDDDDEQLRRRKKVNGDRKEKEEVGYRQNCLILRDEEEEEEEESCEDDEQRKILEIKFLLVDDHQQQQSESCLIELLQKLAAMNTSFKDLKETDIGRHVTKLRKHSSGEVRRLVKTLVRKWKDTVDEWVRLNTPPEETTHTHCIDYEAHHVNGDAEHASVSYNLSCAAKGKHHLENDQETLHGEAKKPRNGRASSFCNNIPRKKNDNGIVTSTKSATVQAKNWW